MYISKYQGINKKIRIDDGGVVEVKARQSKRKNAL